MRTLVFGNSGSGKSRFARRLAVRDGLQILDLDTVVYSPATPAVLRADPDVTGALDAFVGPLRAWVIEGCYGHWIEHLLAPATELVFMNPGPTVCR